MNGILEELRDLEHQLEGNEYCPGGVSYFFAADKVEILSDMKTSLKEYFLEIEAVKEDEEIELQRIEDPKKDMRAICEEWHLSAELTERLIKLVSESRSVYKFCEDYYYIAAGNVGDIFRVLETDDGVFVLEFYVVD
ncbi:MAG: hypothetical protein K6F75_02945 [Butyrivibrio sp.]|nr:hypothetical protein [Butyrivibrio sp.]